MEPRDIETIPDDPASPAEETSEPLNEEESDYPHIEWAGYI